MLATASPEGIPQAATVYYVVDDDFVFYFLTHLDSRKAKNLKTQSDAALVIGFGPELKTVQSGGKIEIMEDWRTGTLFRKGVTLKMMEKIERDLSKWPIMRIDKGEELTALRMVPEWMTFLNLEESDTDMYSEEFHRILP